MYKRDIEQAVTTLTRVPFIALYSFLVVELGYCWCTRTEGYTS